jgi:type VI protein secretion system component Hcp
MANDGNDILMQLQTDDGSGLQAECQTEVNTDLDDYVWDYYNGTFFEIKDFSLGFKIEDRDSTKDGSGKGASGQALVHGSGRPLIGAGLNRTSPGSTLAAKQEKEAKSAQGIFSRWKSATADDLRGMKRYPCKPDEFELTRDYDKASSILFRSCCDSVPFKSASMVKRKVVGGDKLRGYLRLEFEDVLITHVGWQNGEVLQEKVRFMFRKIRIRYRATALRKSSEEAILEELPNVEWSYEADLRNQQQSL